jgi:hypothetical protein
MGSQPPGTADRCRWVQMAAEDRTTGPQDCDGSENSSRGWTRLNFLSPGGFWAVPGVPPCQGRIYRGVVLFEACREVVPGRTGGDGRLKAKVPSRKRGIIKKPGREEAMEGVP